MISNRIPRWIAAATLVLGAYPGIEAQELLTIDRSLDIAVANSPEMQQTELALVQSQERLNAQRIPSR